MLTVAPKKVKEQNISAPGYSVKDIKQSRCQVMGWPFWHNVSEGNLILVRCHHYRMWTMTTVDAKSSLKKCKTLLRLSCQIQWRCRNVWHIYGLIIATCWALFTAECVMKRYSFNVSELVGGHAVVTANAISATVFMVSVPRKWRI